MQTSKHDAKYSSIVGSGVGGMPRMRYTNEAAKRPSIHTHMFRFTHSMAGPQLRVESFYCSECGVQRLGLRM